MSEQITDVAEQSNRSERSTAVLYMNGVAFVRKLSDVTPEITVPPNDDVDESTVYDVYDDDRAIWVDNITYVPPKMRLPKRSRSHYLSHAH